MLDRLDKGISSLVFRLVLPPPLEYALSIPGAWFGCPIFSLGLIPLALAGINGRGTSAAKLTVLPLLAGLGLWLKCASAGRDPAAAARGEGIRGLYMVVFNKPLVFLALPHAAMLLIHATGLGAYGQPAALYLTSWYLVQAAIEALKSLTWRLRPTVVLAEELKTVRRTLPELPASVQDASQANSSFPSGDAAGGAAFATALALASPELWAPSMATAALCCLGRMYFHAHHLLDVLVGALLGHSIVLLLSRSSSFHWGHVFCAKLAFMIAWKPLQRFKPKTQTA